METDCDAATRVSEGSAFEALSLKTRVAASRKVYARAPLKAGTALNGHFLRGHRLIFRRRLLDHAHRLPLPVHESRDEDQRQNRDVSAQERPRPVQPPVVLPGGVS